MDKRIFVIFKNGEAASEKLIREVANKLQIDDRDGEATFSTGPKWNDPKFMADELRKCIDAGQEVVVMVGNVANDGFDRVPANDNLRLIDLLSCLDGETTTWQFLHEIIERQLFGDNGNVMARA